MIDIKVTSSVPNGWDERSSAQQLGLYGAAWRTALENSLGVSFAYITKGNEPIALVSIFKRGPIRLAYAGFPSGAAYVPHDALDALSAWGRQHSITAVRFSSRSDSRDCRPPYPLRLVGAVSGTRIDALSGWDERNYEKSRRTANRNTHSNLTIRPGLSEDDAQFMARCYRETVERQHGSIKYSDNYFNALVTASLNTTDIRCRIAEIENQRVGFHCSVRHGVVAFYLHGGSNDRGRRCYASDLLMLDCLRWAKYIGCNCFDFLSSPKAQGRLVRYKEAWGGVTSELCVNDVVLSPVANFLMRVGVSLTNVASSLR